MEPQRDVVREVTPARPQWHRLLHGLLWGVGALGLIALGALGAILGPRYLGDVLPIPAATAPTSLLAAPPTEPAAASAPAATAEVVLSPEAVRRAGIMTAPAEVVASQAVIQLPGTVTADAYREVKVVPIAGGIVTRVHVELGTTVKRGAPLATLFSPELAEAQTKYLSMRAMLVADQHKLQRVQQLVAVWGGEPSGARRHHGGPCQPCHGGRGCPPAAPSPGAEPGARRGPQQSQPDRVGHHYAGPDRWSDHRSYG